MAQGAETDAVSSAGGRTPGPYSVREAYDLFKAVWNRDSSQREWVGTLRHLYRSGQFDRRQGRLSLEKAIWDRSDKWQDAMTSVNFIKSNIDIIASAIAGRVPDASFDPSNPNDPEALANADYASALVMGFIEEDNVADTLYQMALDSCISGHGFGHARWLRRVRPMTERERAAALRAKQMEYIDLAEQRAAEMVAQGIPVPEDFFTPPDDLGSQITYEVVLENRPTLEYISPIHVLTPSDIREVIDAPWYAIVRNVRLSALRGDDTLDQETVERLAPSDDTENENRRLDDPTNEQAIDPMVRVVYFYDVFYHRLLILADGVAQALYEGDNPNSFSDVCLVDIRAFRDGERFRGFGDLEGIAGLLSKASTATQQQIENLDRQGPILATWQNVLSESDKTKLMSAQPYDLVELSRESLDALREISPDGVLDPQRLLTTIHTIEPLPADLFQVKAALKEDAAEAAGVSEFMRGGLGPSRMPGTAAAAAEGWAGVRMSVRENGINKAYQRVVQLFYKLCQQHLDEGEVVRMIGQMGENWEETVAKDRLGGGFYVRIRTGSLQASNPAIRAQRGAQAMAIADQLEANGWDVEGLREVALRDMGIDPKMARLRKLPPTPAPPPGAAPGAMPVEPPALSGQQEIAAAGGPPLPGDSGAFAF